MTGDQVACQFYRETTPPRCSHPDAIWFLTERTTACVGMPTNGCPFRERRESEIHRLRADDAMAEREARTRAANTREWDRWETARLETAFLARGAA